MGVIHRLDDSLVNKIAAGEVIERPANVIKELVENSIDAKATQITIEVRDGGLTSMRVVDNGTGMSKEDALLCFERHATSKITDDFDLFRISSLGFRGEAIPSIAAVSCFLLKTSGISVEYEFGELKNTGHSDARQGCDITVSSLFQNVPARLKYMRAPNREFAMIQSFIEKLALSYPEIAFRLYHQDHLVFKTAGSGKLLEVIATLYGLNTARSMAAVDFGDEEFHFQGYLSLPQLTRASKNYMLTFVNHRYVRNALTVETINQAYRPFLADDRYPLAFLNLTVDPYLVDVNVHPAKLQVRFSKQDHLKEVLDDGLEDFFRSHDLTHQGKVFTETARSEQQYLDISPDEKMVEEPQHLVLSGKDMALSKLGDKISQVEVPESPVASPKAEKPVSKPLKKHLRVKGQVRGTYIFAEDDQGMYLIDQHAAKERINYEYYLARFASMDRTMSDLLIPIVLHYPPSQFQVLAERKDQLEEVGINLEPFGQNSYVVKQLPVWMQNIDEQLYIEAMVEQVLNGRDVDVAALRKHAVATLSCKASVKGNTYLDMANMQSIVDDLMRCDNPYNCPHGRPTMIAYSDYQLEKLFKRVS